MKKLISLSGIAFFVFLFSFSGYSQESAYQCKNYIALKKELNTGWGTYNTRDVLSQVLLPDCIEISIDFKYQGTNFGGYLEEAQITGDSLWRDAKVQPLAHSLNGEYSELTLDWQDIKVRIQTASNNNELYVLITPMQTMKHPSQAIVKSGLLWNKPGTISRKDGTITIKTPGKTVQVFPATQTKTEYNVSASTPYFCLKLDKTTGFCTGKQRNISEIEKIINKHKQQFLARAAKYGKNLEPAYIAIITSLGFNTIFDPIHNRTVSMVSRQWNVKRGGYSFFGWDNFFLAYLSALESKELAFANVIEHLHDKTEEGFIPNCSQGNGRKTWDRSQPPVGALMALAIYKKYPEKWFIDAVFNELLTWNRWWIKRRMNQNLLSWGSHPSKNPYHDKRYNDAGAAMLETGLDDSPMYYNVPFDTVNHTMMLHDVGLNGLYIADCEALAEIAQLTGRKKEAEELKQRAKQFRKQAQILWNEETGLFLNKRTDTNTFSNKLSPTLFYALLGKMATQKQAERIINEHLYNNNEFWGEWVLPSIARNDPAFKKQKYWKGAIWAPLNFLVYLSLNQYELPKARKDLAEKSRQLFVKEWKRKGYVSENYSSITGTGDDHRIKSDRFYTWGALMGIIPFMEAGFMPAP